MENKEFKPLDPESPDNQLCFSPAVEKDYYVNLNNQLIKLLYIIEDEQNGKGEAKLWLHGFMFELSSANVLCKGKLTKVVIKVHGLYENNHYKEMTHKEIKRQIMESRGIIDHLISEIK